jgi:DNA replication protein DnaC
MASALEESLTALSHKKLAPTAWLSQLLQAEVADRQARSYEYQLRLARFPMPRDLDSFDFRESAVNETQLRQLYTGEYLTGARNIVFVGRHRYRQDSLGDRARPPCHPTGQTRSLLQRR